MTDFAQLQTRLSKLAQPETFPVHDRARLITCENIKAATAMEQEISETVLRRCLTFHNDHGQTCQIEAQNGAALTPNAATILANFAKVSSWITVETQSPLAKPSPIGPFLQSLSDGLFDAVHVQGAAIIARVGEADDLVELALRLATEKNAGASAFACSARHDADHILFCGAVDGAVVVLRTRTIGLQTILQKWRSGS